MNLRNWLIGAYIVEYEQHGSDRAEYGERLLERLAKDLSREFGRGSGCACFGRARTIGQGQPYRAGQDLSAEDLDMGQSGHRALLNEMALELKMDKNEAIRLARLPLTIDGSG